MLYVFPENKIAFYHLHRTAGGTISRIIGKALNEKRLLIAQDKRCHETFEWCSKKYYTQKIQLVTSFRNPYDQVISLYNWIRKGIKDRFVRNLQKKCRPEQLKVHTMSFENFTDWYCDHWKSYFEWLQIDNKIPNFFFIKKENFQENIAQFLGIPIDDTWYKWRWWHSNGKTDRNRDNYYTQQYMYDRITGKQKWCFDQGLYDII